MNLLNSFTGGDECKGIVKRDSKDNGDEQEFFEHKTVTIGRIFNVFSMEWHDKWNDVSANKCTN